MSDIVLSKGIRNNLLQLQNTASNIGLTQGRLATGKKVNSALDNPANFFTSSALNSRAGDLGDLLDGIGNSIQTIQAANNGITAITNLVKSAQSTAKQAIQSAPTAARIQGQATSSGANTTLAASTALTGLKLADGTTAAFAANDTITVGDGTTTGTFTVGTDGTTVQSFIDKVNSTASLAVKASLSSDGKLILEATGTNSIVIGGTTAATNGIDTLGITTSNAKTIAGGTLNGTRTTLAAQYDTIRTQIDQLAKDAGYNGKNLLAGDSIKVVFNEKTGANQNSLAISGVDDSSTGLGISASANNFQTDKDINDSLTELTNALSTLRTQSSTLGSNLSVVQTRQDFTKQTINTLKVGADNLVLADQNEEAANLLALQTRQQLSQTALSLANQADQGVLRLFG